VTHEKEGQRKKFGQSYLRRLRRNEELEKPGKRKLEKRKEEVLKR